MTKRTQIIKGQLVEVKEGEKEEDITLNESSSSMNQFNRGTLEYALPWSVLAHIFRYAWKGGMVCSCVYPDIAKQANEQVYDGNNNKDPTYKWRLQLSLVSKRVFQLVSIMFTDIVVGLHCQDFGVHLSRDTCPINKITHLVIAKDIGGVGGVGGQDIFNQKQQMAATALSQAVSSVTKLTIKSDDGENMIVSLNKNQVMGVLQQQIGDYPSLKHLMFFCLTNGDDWNKVTTFPNSVQILTTFNGIPFNGVKASLFQLFLTRQLININL
ncbi:hypothetical protein DFA_11122 [Cavenderia fasciculata]|uniref:Uncharacterized protein n=1 Tax=Cavenderia fasciculata TaxID=261658 RepID=F4QF02_CACFS|nr:uncharacterized protein DFA_11122 [Cavenderia fasciculata]EGG13361.1 hypothetical protein DFA_11122 [Cavenderia fasciculata]|eukprot:XP_004350065.1 hypothetical protein DFA_11122 [Cavenderia fasciculata]